MSQDVDDGAAETGEATEGSSPSETMVPLSVMLAERGRHEDKFAAKVAELEGKINAVATKPEKEFTRAELQQQVDDGRMTPDESDRILFDQMKRTVKADVTKDLQAENQAARTDATVQADIDLYTKARPDIMTAGSEDRALVEAEYQRQTTEFGKPANAATERDALAVVFGPSNRLQNGKAKEAQTYQETGGDGGGEEKGTAAPKLPANVKAHYDKMISQGMYKGYDDPSLKAEVEKYGSRWT